MNFLKAVLCFLRGIMPIFVTALVVVLIISFSIIILVAEPVTMLLQILGG